MYRTALCIKMLIKLKAENRVTTRELAEYLDTNPRNIREFRKELEHAGYKIQEIRGRNGGYMLDDRSFLPVPALSDEQVQILDQGRRFMDSHPEFSASQEYQEILNQILCCSQTGKGSSSLSYHSGTRSLSKAEQEMLELAQNAIENHETLLLTYQGRNKEVPSDVKVDPYHIVCIEDHYYLIGWSHTAKDYRNYKFSEYRMNAMKKTGTTFAIDSYFNYAQYIGTNSAFKDKLCIYTVRVKEKAQRLFREQYWGTGLQLTGSHDGWHTYQFTSDDPYGTYMRLFEFGGDVELLSPEDKREAFIQRIREILPVYDSQQ